MGNYSLIDFQGCGNWSAGPALVLHDTSLAFTIPFTICVFQVTSTVLFRGLPIRSAWPARIFKIVPVLRIINLATENIYASWWSLRIVSHQHFIKTKCTKSPTHSHRSSRSYVFGHRIMRMSHPVSSGISKHHIASLVGFRV